MLFTLNVLSLVLAQLILLINCSECTSCEDRQARGELDPSWVGEALLDRAFVPINTHELGLARLTELAL